MSSLEKEEMLTSVGKNVRNNQKNKNKLTWTLHENRLSDNKCSDE